MSSGIVYGSYPTKHVFKYAPASTSFALVTMPNYVENQMQGGKVTLICVATGEIAAGSTFLVAFGNESADPSAVADGYPVLPSTSLTIDIPDKIWIKLGASTDVVKMLFEF